MSGEAGFIIAHCVKGCKVIFRKGIWESNHAFLWMHLLLEGNEIWKYSLVFWQKSPVIKTVQEKKSLRVGIMHEKSEMKTFTIFVIDRLF